MGWHPERLRVQLAFGMIVGASAQALPPDAPERRCALREVKARLHQTSFRDAVLAAYGGRCAISHLPEPRLLDAANIVMDADEQLGAAHRLKWPAVNEDPSCGPSSSNVM
jgi:putative restriction endonuclease